ARSWGIGGSKSRALTAAETLITGALGGQGDLQLAANTLAPYAAAAIGRRFGHGENKNEAAQAIGHFMLGAALAYANGADPLAGGSAAVAAERAAEYLAGQYDDGRTAIDPISGKFNPNLLPEHIKEEIKAQTGALASVVGAAGGSLNGTNSSNGALFDAQIAGTVGQNAVKNNLLSSKDKQRYDLLAEKILNRTASNAEKAEFEWLAAQDQQSNELYRKYYSDLHRKDGKKELTAQEADILTSYIDSIYDNKGISDRKARNALRKIRNDLYQGKEILRNGEPYYPFWLAKRDEKVRELWNKSWKEIRDTQGKYKTGLAAVKHYLSWEGRPIGRHEKAWNILERDRAYAESVEGRAVASTAQGMALLLEFTTRGRYLMTALGGVQAGLGINQIKQGDVEHGKANFFLGAGTMLGSVSLGGASVKKSPLAIREPIPAGYNRPPTSLDVNAGRMTNTFSTAHPTVTNLNAFKRLNVIDDAVRKFAPAEAATAAQLEKYLGRMERISGVSNGKSADFIIINGANKGKTVDMMYTTKNLTDQQINKMNQFYKKNMESGVEKTNILKHLEKADIVPMDIRFFTFENRLILLNHIKTLPKNLQRKIIIVR
ncbi:TPA: VENN motif pre-toxin domain-containing protein, partial [Neisseria lactamica]